MIDPYIAYLLALVAGIAALVLIDNRARHERRSRRPAAVDRAPPGGMTN